MLPDMVGFLEASFLLSKLREGDLFFFFLFCLEIGLLRPSITDPKSFSKLSLMPVIRIPLRWIRLRL